MAREGFALKSQFGIEIDNLFISFTFFSMRLRCQNAKVICLIVKMMLYSLDQISALYSRLHSLYTIH